MPDIAQYHPQVVHFVVALGMLGVALRLISITGLIAWTRPAATLLLLLAAGAAVVAAEAGHQAHGAAERIPGVREAVQEHEDLGMLTRNLFLVVAGLELTALAVRKNQGLMKGLLALSGFVGVGAVATLYEAAEHGGNLVYEYAGGVGTRSGEPEDVTRLLVAGLYHQAEAARASGRLDEAARLIEELTHQRPNDPAVKLLAAESMLKDRKDPAAALVVLDSVSVPEDDRFVAVRKGLLTSDALVAEGKADSAKVVLTALAQQYPDSRGIKSALAKLN